MNEQNKNEKETGAAQMTAQQTEEVGAEAIAAQAATEGEKKPSKVKNFFRGFVKRYFIDAFSGMALGLFCTLIAGTIIGQIGEIIGKNNVAGKIFINIASIAKMIMGAGIGVGIAHSLKSKKLVAFSAAVAGMIGANITQIFVQSGIPIWGVKAGNGFMSPGDPVAAYIAAVFAVEVADLVEGKTPVDILIVPLTAIFSGALASIALGIPFSMLFSLLGKGISYATQIEPISMGIIVAAVMGLLLTFPTSSAAFGVMLFSNVPQDLQQGAALAAGAAVAGCAAHMVGFAVASFRENQWGGLIAQGLGTSMLQIPNLAKNMRILIPAIAASVVAGPMSSAVFGLMCNATGSGMGTAGLVGTIQTFMVSIGEYGQSWWLVTVGVLVCQFLIPVVVSLLVSEFMRKKKWIKFGDMKLAA